MKGNLDETAQFEYFTGVIRIHSKLSLVVVLALMVSRCDTEKYTKIKPAAALSSTSGSNFTASLSAPRPPAISRRASVPRVVGKSNKESLLIVCTLFMKYCEDLLGSPLQERTEFNHSYTNHFGVSVNLILKKIGFRSFRFQSTASGHFVVHSCLGFKGPKALVTTGE